MKIARRLFLVTVIATFILQGCMKDEVNEVSINDLNSLIEEFKSPSPEYTTSPFFVWNYKITKEEIDKYLTDFKNAGSSQVFIHPRPGLITEYLSDEWFDLYKYTIEKGKELGMLVWIYDENSYPSGFAGGHVPDRMPESYNQGQGLRLNEFEILPDTADKYFLCLKEEENGAFTDITTSLAAEKGKTGKYLLFSKTFFRNGGWFGGFTYVDLLYPGVTEKFLEITMDSYEEKIGYEFGKTIPGVFTDEPEISSPGGIRWTPDLFDVFLEKWGYDLKVKLPSLFEEVGDWKKVRHNYTQTLLQMFIDRWAKPYYNYCEAKGLKFTGHYWEHSWPGMQQGGDNMAMYAWHQVPGIDMLFNQYNDSSVRAQFGNIRSVKELASAANQTGRQRKLSETYGGGAWELTFTDMKRLGDWEYALGVNLMNQHLSHITLAGARKYDYPPTFTYHEPWWNNYKYINDHYARLSVALSAGRQVNDILILEPTTSAWLYDSYTKRNPQNGAIGQTFQDFVTLLEKSQVEYDLGSENIIKDMGSVKGGKLTIGHCSYSTVVIPPLTENIDLTTFRLLQKFVAGGGKLVAFAIPSLCDGSENEKMNDFFDKHSGKIAKVESLNDEVIAKYFSSPDISFSGVTGEDLYHNRRELADGQVLFITNSSLTEDLSGSLKVSGADALVLNTFTGAVNGYPHDQTDKTISLSFNLPPAGSMLFYFPKVKQGTYDPLSLPSEFTPVAGTPGMDVKRDNENAIAIEFCDLLLDGKLAPDLHNYTAADMVYKHYGFKDGNPWNHAVQFKTNITDRDNFDSNTGFTAEYHFIIKEKFDYSTLTAVVERPDLWTVSFNGTEISPENGQWWLDREFAVFRIGDLVKTGKNTISLKTSPMKIHAEIEPVYIKGEFSVNPADKGWTLGAPVKALTAGSWKDQGLPFYSWGVTYSKEFTGLSTGTPYKIKLNKWNGTIAEVSVNDKWAGVIAFPPFDLDVTEFITSGTNRIDVRVIGSLKNLMGPHFNNPAPGMVGPGHWRNVKSYPSGKNYQLLDYGLMEEFDVLQGK